MNFAAEIINWYHKNKRRLPWRNITDAYIIWLSEIILQQTRVDQGMPYFYRFAEHYPTVSALAGASEDEVLRLWQGLGYYSRARNMHHTAKFVQENYNGIFPTEYSELIKLKGVGEYTAAAIASFTANEARAVVDGNVFRVLSRYYGIDTPINSARGKKEFNALANMVMDVDNAGIYNQAIMEFGSLQCKPKKPLCATCPLALSCVAYQENRISLLPVKLKKQAVKERYFNYIVIENEEGGILIQKRGANDIWQNLYEFPLIETLTAVTAQTLVGSDEFVKRFGSGAGIEKQHGPVIHLLSHQRLHTQFITIKNAPETALNGNQQFVLPADLAHLPKPKLIFEFVNKFLN